MNSLTSPKRTMNFIRSNEGLRNRFNSMQFSVGVTFFIYIFFFSILNCSFNFYYFFLDSLKAFIFIVVCYTLVYVLFDHESIVLKWKNKDDRIKIFLGKWSLSLIQASKIFILSIILLLIIHLSGSVKKLENRFFENYPDKPSPFSYSPNIIEGLLIGLIIVLALFTMFTAAYWSVARFITITGYLNEKKLVKAKTKPFILGLFLQLPLLLIFTIILDGMFMEIKNGDIHNNWNRLYPLLEGREYFILIIQAILLFILNLLYFIDGYQKMMKREDFVKIEL